MTAPVEAPFAPALQPTTRADEVTAPPVVVPDEDPSLPALVAPVLATVTVISEGGWSRELAAYLGAEGFAVILDPLGDSAFDHRSRVADAAILDLRLASRSATAVCAAWHRRSSAPVIAIAPRDEAVVIAAFGAGADQVLVEDLTPRQLVAHLRALLRRVPPRRPAAPAPSTGRIALGEDERSAIVTGRVVRLSEDEFRLLALLLERPGRVVPRGELTAALPFSVGSSRAVDFSVRRLREKLEEVDGRRRIVVVRGVGFRFDATGEGS